jgi:hypothetical protein
MKAGLNKYALMLGFSAQNGEFEAEAQTVDSPD